MTAAGGKDIYSIIEDLILWAGFEKISWLVLNATGYWNNGMLEY